MEKFSSSLVKRDKKTQAKLLDHPKQVVSVKGDLDYNWNSVPIQGSLPKREKIPINTPCITGQRVVKAQTINGWIEEEEGINFSLMLPAVAARWTDNDGDIQLRLFDGGHRSILRLLASQSPFSGEGEEKLGENEMWADIVEVDDEYQANLYFLNLNYARRKPMQTEDVFVNGFVGKCEKYTKYRSVLTNNKIQVKGSSGLTVPRELKDTGCPSVSVKCVKQSEKVISDPHQFSAAVDINKTTFGNQDFNTRLFQGLVSLCKTYSALCYDPELEKKDDGSIDYKKSNWRAVFQIWLEGAITETKDKKPITMAPDAFARKVWNNSTKTKGFVAQSMAYSLIKMFNDSSLFTETNKHRKDKWAVSPKEAKKLIDAPDESDESSDN